MQNPYANRAMIRNAQDFIGRERELRNIYSLLTKMQNVSIVGERRTGKSSLLYCLSLPEVQARLGQSLPHHTFIYLDLESKTRMKPMEFLTHLLQEANQGLPANKRVTIPETMDSGEFEDGIEAFNERGVKPVFLLDEFDAVTRNEHFDLDFFSALRSVTNRYDMALITASRADLKTLSHSAIESSPFFNIFYVERLGLFPESEARELISKPSAESGLPLEEHIDLILELAGRHPFFLQLFCFRLWDAVRAGQEPADLEAAKAAFLEDAEAHYAYSWEHLTEQERKVLKGLVSEGTVVIDAETRRQLARKAVCVESEGRPRLYSSGFEAFVRSDRAVIAVPDRKRKKKVEKKTGMAGFWQKWRSTLVLAGIGVIILVLISLFVGDPQVIASSVLIPLFMLIIGIVMDQLNEKTEDE